MSDWAAFKLSKRQALYAAQDALVCGGVMRQMVLLSRADAPAASSVPQHPASSRSHPSPEQPMLYLGADDQPSLASPAQYPSVCAEPSPAQPVPYLGTGPQVSTDRAARKPRRRHERPSIGAEACGQPLRDSQPATVPCPVCRKMFRSAAARDRHKLDTGHLASSLHSVYANTGM
jgi:hypothetical protein